MLCLGESIYLFVLRNNECRGSLTVFLPTVRPGIPQRHPYTIVVRPRYPPPFTVPPSIQSYRLHLLIHPRTQIPNKQTMNRDLLPLDYSLQEPHERITGFPHLRSISSTNRIV